MEHRNPSGEGQHVGGAADVHGFVSVLSKGEPCEGGAMDDQVQICRWKVRQAQAGLTHVADKGRNLAWWRRSANPGGGPDVAAVVAAERHVAVLQGGQAVSAAGKMAGQLAADQAAGAGDEDLHVRGSPPTGAHRAQRHA